MRPWAAGRAGEAGRSRRIPECRPRRRDHGRSVPSIRGRDGPRVAPRHSPASGGPTTPPAKGAVPDPGSKLKAGDFALPGEDPPGAFVPTRPRTVDEQKKVEAHPPLRRGPGPGGPPAVPRGDPVLEKALACDPDSIADPPPPRPAQLRPGPRGRRDRREPPGPRRRAGRRRDDRAARRTLPRRPPTPRPRRPQGGAGQPEARQELRRRPLLEFELAKLYEATGGSTRPPTCFARVVDALDDKANARLSHADLARILGDDEAAGLPPVRPDLLPGRARSTSPSRRSSAGLVYDHDDPSLILALSPRPSIETAAPPRPWPTSRSPSSGSRRGARATTSWPRSSPRSSGRRRSSPGSRQSPRPTPRTSRSSTPWPTATRPPARPRRPTPSTSPPRRAARPPGLRRRLPPAPQGAGRPRSCSACSPR